LNIFSRTPSVCTLVPNFLYGQKSLRFLILLPQNDLAYLLILALLFKRAEKIHQIQISSRQQIVQVKNYFTLRSQWKQSLYLVKMMKQHQFFNSRNFSKGSFINDVVKVSHQIIGGQKNENKTRNEISNSEGSVQENKFFILVLLSLYLVINLTL